MSQLMQKSGANFVPEHFFIPFRKIPYVLEKQNDLGRQNRCAVIGKFSPSEQPKCVRLNAIRL